MEDVTLIIDEFHYIFENADRARTYIDALHNSKAKNILLCSATLGDISKLVKYVDRVSGRDFMDYQNDSRLTSLYFEGDIDYNDIENALIVTFSKRNIYYILDGLENLRDMQSNEKLEEIERLAIEDNIENYDLLCYARKGLAGYYGSLLPKEKLFIEKCFERGLIDTVVGTDALALGVNFPVKNVIFAQLAKYYDGPISKNLFDQLAGRAGRKGYFDNGYVYYCSDFSNSLEAWEYDTEELFDALLESENEDIYIRLSPNIRNILQGKSTIEDEAKFIANFSTDSVDIEEEINDISGIVEYIREYAFENEIERIIDIQLENEEYDDYENNDYDFEEEENNDERRQQIRQELLLKKDEFDQNISRVYFDEYSPTLNCKIFTEILCGVEPDEILERYTDSDNFYGMLQFRKYVKSLPKKYRKGLTKINDMIRTIDETAIDGFRGTVSVDEVGRRLEQDHRLERQNIMNVLNEQAISQTKSEKTGAIDDKLKQFDEYSWGE